MLTAFYKKIKFSLISLRKKLTEKQFIIVAAAIVGLSTSIVVIILKTFVFWLHKLFTENTVLLHWKYSFAFLPVLGIIFTVWLVKNVFKGLLLKGSDKVVYAIAKKSSFLPKSQMYSHVITSALTIGTGGSAGLESPIVSTGAAIGSNFAKTYQLNYKDRTLLLACGVSAGIAAAFNAPIAGVLFAIEVLLVDISIGAFIPLIMAAASGTLLSKIILKEGILLSFSSQLPFNYNNVPFYILLGVLAGFISLYYAKVFTRLEHQIIQIKSSYKRAIIGGLLLSVLILIFPTLFGEGYESIKSLANMQPEKIFDNSILHMVFENKGIIILGITIIMLLKVIATALTLSSGGNGGNFAPSLFVGAYLGFTFSSVLQLFGFNKVPSSNYTIVAMAGILSGVFYAPLTAIFLIAEITGGYELMIPLMIVSAISYAIVKSFQPLSMEMKRLADTNKIHTHDKDKFLLSKLELSELIESDYIIIKPEYRLTQLVEIIKKSDKNTFPVIDKAGQLIGIIKLNQIKNIIFNREKYDNVFIKDLMQDPVNIITEQDDIHSIIPKLNINAENHLPVVYHGKYIGFASRYLLLTKYRDEILKTS